MANRGREGDQHYELDTSDEFHTYDATEGSGGGRPMLLFLVFLIVLLGFGGILYLVYQQGMREGIRNAPPLIEADEGPAKIIPADPGGMDIPNTDKLIYDRMNGNNPAEPGVERLLPRAEEPIERSRVPGVAPEGTQRDRVEVSPPPLDIVPDPATRVPETPSQSVVPVPVAPSLRGAPNVLPGAAPAPVIPVETPESGETPEPGAGATSGNGNFVVQIAAFRNAQRAREEFNKLQVANPDLLGGLRSDIARADLGDRGIYYRLRVGPFETSDAAGVLCRLLKGRGQDCIVRAR